MAFDILLQFGNYPTHNSLSKKPTIDLKRTPKEYFKPFLNCFKTMHTLHVVQRNLMHVNVKFPLSIEELVF